MGDAEEDRAKAEQLPEGDVIRILLEQHARIRELFSELETVSGDEKQRVFDDLRSLLAVHETAEEIVVRPLTRDIAPDGVAEARNHEEEEATKVLKELEGMDIGSSEFDATALKLKESVSEHAEAEEHQEFPAVLDRCTEEERQSMGSRVRKAEDAAPTHPHPSTAGSPAAQKVVGPFAALMDKVRDALSKDRADTRPTA